MRSISTLFLLFALLISTSGCDSDTVGPDNAGVFSFSTNFDLFQASRDGNFATSTFNIVDITPDVVDFGAVLVYYRFENTWNPLPFTFAVEALDDPPRVDYSATFSYAYDDSFLQVFVEASTDDDVVWAEIENTPLFDSNVPIKVVIIESLPIGKQAPVNFKDYQAVKAYYGLRD